MISSGLRMTGSCLGLRGTTSPKVTWRRHILSKAVRIAARAQEKRQHAQLIELRRGGEGARIADADLIRRPRLDRCLGRVEVVHLDGQQEIAPRIAWRLTLGGDWPRRKDRENDAEEQRKESMHGASSIH